MNSRNDTDSSPDTSAPHLPMAGLFYLLHSNGFPIKPDDYIEMLKIIERFGSKDLDATAAWICPVIATSYAEQARFCNIIEQYKQIEAIPSVVPAAIKHDDSRQPWLIATIAACVLVGVLVATFWPKKVWSPAASIKEFTVKAGAPLPWDASPLFTNPADTNKITFKWRFPDGNASGLRVYHTFKTPGSFQIIRTFVSAKRRLMVSGDTLTVHVCNELPLVHLQRAADPVPANSPITISANVKAKPGSVLYYKWTLKDTVYRTFSPVLPNIIFPREGEYPIECKAVVGHETSPCSATDNAMLQVVSNTGHYYANFSVPSPGSYEQRSGTAAWLTLLILLPAAAASFYAFRVQKKKAAPEIPKPATNSARGPYEIPFEEHDTKLVQQERDFRRALLQFRYTAEAETMDLNINGTIRSIIRSGGVPNMVFVPRGEAQEYLFLIERSNPRNMITRFFTYVTRCIKEAGIPVTVFYYDKSFTCFNESFPGGLSLNAVADKWDYCTLIILGRAHELVFNVYPVMQESFLAELNRWQRKAIVTPEPVLDWGAKEKVLQEHLVLIPADVYALQKLIPALREKIKVNRELLCITLPDQYSLRESDFHELDSIKTYLNNDEQLFQWLCALAIYPRINWEVTVELGYAIMDAYGQPEKLNYSSLLKICRIPWMQQGVFPQATRLELLKALLPSNEIRARETFLHMLNYSTILHAGENYFYAQEKQRQILTNQFVLHASDAQRFRGYAASEKEFKKIWKNNGLLDVPVKKYLDKKDGDKWQTPIGGEQRSLGLSSYFQQAEESARRIPRHKRILAMTMASLLLLSWLFLNFSGRGAQLLPAYCLGQLKHPATVTANLIVTKNFRRCGDSATNKFAHLKGYLAIKDKRFSLKFNSLNNLVTASIPWDSYEFGVGTLQLSWGGSAAVSSKIHFAGIRLPDSVLISCLGNRVQSKRALYVRYNDTTGFNTIEASLATALYNYKLSTDQADFEDSSRLIYYEPSQKPEADSLVAILKRETDLDVREDYIPERRMPPATPILFINTKSKEQQTAAVTNENNATADDYHRLGDTYFSKNEFQKAIDAYTTSIRLSPGNALSFYQRGISYEMLGDAYLLKALKDYSIAIRLNSTDPLYYYRRATIHYQLKDYTAAKKDYDEVITMNDGSSNSQYASALYYRGRCNYLTNNAADACADLKKAITAGVTAANKDYEAWCNINQVEQDQHSDYSPSPPTETDFGYITFTTGSPMPDAAGVQLINDLSAKLKAGSNGMARLTAVYSSRTDSVFFTTAMKNTKDLFVKFGVNANRLSEQMIAGQQQALANQRISYKRIHITGIVQVQATARPKY